jgi:hypothetical protein
VLAELWDFDTRISTKGVDAQGNPIPAPEDYLQPDAHANLAVKPLRAYTQGPGNYNSGEAYFLAALEDPQWSKYYNQSIGSSTPAEHPPLPPGPYNSNPANNTPDAPHGLYYTHHLIRDFMFLDAAVNNNTTNFVAFQPPQDTGYPYRAVRINLPPPVPDNPNVLNDDPNLMTYTQGTGHQQTPGKWLLKDDSFSPSPTGGPAVDFESKNVAFTALLYELRDGSNQVPNVAPNWFGVAVPDGITDYRNVILYFHPNPTQSGALYNPADYNSNNPGSPEKTGSQGTNWKELFAYVDRLGNQLAGAALYAPTVLDSDPRNQILILPFMQNYDDVGILPQYWYFIIRDILDDIVTNGV